MKKTLQPMGSYQLRILAALQHKPMYQGTVTGATKAQRRAANKRARVARRHLRAA